MEKYDSRKDGKGGGSMKIRERIEEMLAENDKVVSDDYYYSHYNVRVFADGKICDDESSYSTDTGYQERPILCVSLKYTKMSEVGKDYYPLQKLASWDHIAAEIQEKTLEESLIWLDEWTKYEEITEEEKDTLKRAIMQYHTEKADEKGPVTESEVNTILDDIAKDIYEDELQTETDYQEIVDNAIREQQAETDIDLNELLEKKEA